MRNLGRLLRIFFTLFAVIALIGVAFGVVTPDKISDFLVGSGAVNAMAGGQATEAESVEGGPSTTETAGDKSTILDNTLSKNITKMAPSKAPLDTILRELGIVVPVESWVTEWYSVNQRGIEDTLAAGYTTGNADGSGVVTLTVTNAHIWSLDDNALFQGQNGDDGQEIIGHIVSKSGNDLGIYPLNNTDLPSMSAGQAITRVGNAKAELDAKTAPYSIYPQKQDNHSQIHMRQVEESVYQQLHKKEVQWGFGDHKLQSLYDLRMSMEFTSLFGVKAKINDPVRESHDEKYFSGGIVRYIPNTLQYTFSSGIDKAKFIDWQKDVFTGNSGSDTRILFAGSDLMAQLAQVETISKQLENKETFVKWGIQFNEIVTNFGRFLVKHHDLFNFVGWGQKGVVLDVNNLEKHVFKAMQTRELDLKKSGAKLVNAAVIEEAFCVVTRYQDTHRIIESI